jgi:hypothetical protein
VLNDYFLCVKILFPNRMINRKNHFWLTDNDKRFLDVERGNGMSKYARAWHRFFRIWKNYFSFHGQHSHNIQFREIKYDMCIDLKYKLTSKFVKLIILCFNANNANQSFVRFHPTRLVFKQFFWFNLGKNYRYLDKKSLIKVRGNFSLTPSQN